MGLRAVVVDDSGIMRRALRGMLERQGVEVLAEGANGAEAVLLCEEHRPDLVTLDIIMPKLDGLGALRVIRSRHPGIRVIMATALSTVAKVKDSMEAGAFGYLVKPYDEQKVAELVAALGRGG